MDTLVRLGGLLIELEPGLQKMSQLLQQLLNNFSSGCSETPLNKN